MQKRNLTPSQWDELDYWDRVEMMTYDKVESLMKAYELENPK